MMELAALAVVGLCLGVGYTLGWRDGRLAGRHLYRVIHNAGCDFAGEIEGDENPAIVISAHRFHAPHPAICTCGVNPRLTKGDPRV